VVCSGLALIAMGTVLGLPDATVTRIEADPWVVRMDGSDGLTQLVVTGFDSKGDPMDLTADAAFAVHDPKIVRVDAGGLVHASGNGKTTLTIRAGGQTTTVPLVVADSADTRLVHFVSEVVPILTKFGCNAGACHGKASGQNGFKLSLLGFDPKSDYDALVREGRGRRIFPSDPARSLFLKKPTAQVPHGGGKRFPIGSPESQRIVRWRDQRGQEPFSKKSLDFWLTLGAWVVLKSKDSQDEISVLNDNVDADGTCC